MSQASGDQPKTPPASPGGRPAPLSDAARHAMFQVLAALKKEPPAEIARIFLRGQAQQAITDGLQLVHWLVALIGKDAATRLVQAFADTPCMHCFRGRNPCTSCGGSGRSSVRGLCESCLGLGQAFCEFCYGSGLSSIGYAPPGLRAEVMVARVRAALIHAKTLLAAPPPSRGEGDPKQAGQACAQMLVTVNQAIGTLEGVLIEMKEAVPAELKNAKRDADIAGACVRAARQLDQRLRQILSLMAATTQESAAAAQTPEARDLAEHAARFYKRLAEESLAFTRLEHPFIHQAEQPPPPKSGPLPGKPGP